MFRDGNAGEIVAKVNIDGGVVTVTGEKKDNFSNAGNLIIGKTVVSLLGKKFVPVYVQFTTPGNILYGMMVKGECLSDKLNSFVSNRLPEYFDIPSNAEVIALRS